MKTTLIVIAWLVLAFVFCCVVRDIDKDTEWP
jgi:hypothetical protein